ncbi:SO1C1-like protein, partial [Mya arenaria]
VSMLEKQFGFSSAETGFLMSCNDIGYLLCVVFAGYIARKVHIPRGLGTSTIFFGVCGLMCALPYFISDRSTYALSDRQPMPDSNISVKSVVSSSSKVPLCLNSSGVGHYDARCDAQSSTAERTAGLQELYIKKVAFTLIAVGMFFQGVGKSCRMPFVSIYIDDAVEKRKTAVDITPRDPRWIGAWWLGFLVFGGFSLLFSIPIMCFPRYLKSHKRRGDLHTIAKEKALQKLEKNSTREAIVKEVKEFLAAVLRLLKNPTYLVLTLSTVVNLMGVAGVLSFMPKYLASQYTLSSIAAISLGSFLGGIITRRIPMTPLTTIKMLLIFYAVNILCSACGFFLGCKQPVLFGDNAQIGCECNDQKYFPICGQDGRSYFSPCHAGCSVKDKRWMPGPVVFGAIIDGTCTLWKYTCGERQSCLLYDIVFFRNAVHGYRIIASALAMIILSSLIFYFRYKGHDDWGDGMRREIEKREVKLNVQGAKPNGNGNENIIAQKKDVEKDTLSEDGN